MAASRKENEEKTLWTIHDGKLYFTWDAEVMEEWEPKAA